MSLKAVFFDAFAGRPRPTADAILAPGVAPEEGRALRELLEARSSLELTPHELRTAVESNLWMLSPPAFLYFLPAFLHSALEHYSSVSVFASELIGALTEPSRDDVVGALDRMAQAQSDLGLPSDAVSSLPQKQLEWFDTGNPTVQFRERFAGVTRAEGAAVLAFLLAFEEAYGEDFPFDELQIAIDRYWRRFDDG